MRTNVEAPQSLVEQSHGIPEDVECPTSRPPLGIGRPDERLLSEAPLLVHGSWGSTRKKVAMTISISSNDRVLVNR